MADASASGMTIHEFFSRLRSLRFPPELRDVTATYRYDVEGAGQWRVLVKGGALEVLEGPGEADCIVSCTAQDFIDLLLGRWKPIIALMQGRVAFQGPIHHLINQTYV